MKIFRQAKAGNRGANSLERSDNVLPCGFAEEKAGMPMPPYVAMIYE